LDFLVKHFSIMGLDGQYWMLVTAAVIAAFVIVARHGRGGI